LGATTKLNLPMLLFSFSTVNLQHFSIGEEIMTLLLMLTYLNQYHVQCEEVNRNLTFIIAPDSFLILDMFEPHLPINPPTIVSEISISNVT
jgi:hypothetical protein